MKKKLACLLTALLVLTCATPVLAAPSTEATQPKVEVEAPEGVTVEVDQEVEETVKQEAAAEATKEAAKVSADTKASVVAVVEINLTEGDIPEGGLKLTLKVDGVKAGENVVLLHKKADGTWETIKPVEVKDGAVVAVFNSLSPVAIVKLAASTTTDTAPKAGVPFVLPVAALVCAAGATVCGRKVKFN